MAAVLLESRPPVFVDRGKADIRGLAMNSLAMLAGDWRGAVPAGGLMAETKFDGWRCLRFRGIDGKPRLWTRGGIPLESADHIAHRLQLLEDAAGVEMVFDGEVQVDGSLAATKAWFEKGWKAGGDAGVFYAFDCLTQAEWRAGGSEVPLYARKARLASLIADVGEPWEWRPRSRGADEGATPVRLVEDEWVFDAGDVLDAATRVWAANGEGIVLKAAESPYRRLRSSAWQKVKAENRHKWMRAVAGATVGA